MKTLSNSSELSLLSKKELRTYSGGEPNEDTGFWYDAFYVFTFTTILNPKPTSLATTVMVNLP